MLDTIMNIEYIHKSLRSTHVMLYTIWTLTLHRDYTVFLNNPEALQKEKTMATPSTFLRHHEFYNIIPVPIFKFDKQKH